MGSVGEATPPEAMILICVAPFCSSSRTARRSASTPSTTRAMAPTLKVQAQGSSTSLRGRRSPWPPVCDSARPEGKMRGPSITPVRTASASDQSAPPASRTVVKPRSSMPLRMGTARSTAKTLGTFARAPMLSCEASTCTWQSIRPGISTRPRALMTRAPAVSTGRSDTDVIFAPSMRTKRSLSRTPAAASSTSACSKTIMVRGLQAGCGGSVCAAGVG